MKISGPELSMKKKKWDRKRVLLANLLVPPMINRQQQTQSQRQKHLSPGKIHWIGPPRESPLYGMCSDTLYLQGCERGGLTTGETLS